MIRHSWKTGLGLRVALRHGPLWHVVTPFQEASCNAQEELFQSYALIFSHRAGPTNTKERDTHLRTPRYHLHPEDTQRLRLLRHRQTD